MENKSFVVELAELITRHWRKHDSDIRHLWRLLLPHPGTVIFIALVVAGLLWTTNAGAIPVRAPFAATTSTSTIAYQGRLADSDGNPITDTVNMEFRLYDVPEGGTPLWEELWTGSNGVQVSDGLFNVMLGSLNPIPQAVITGNDNLWLGITVGTDDEMEPRVQLGSVPFAVQALTVPDESVTTNKLADGAVTQAKLGSDISLEPPDGSITTAKIADGAVTSAKLEHAGPHIPITPGENGLVKMAVLRQDNTTNTYSKDQVILTGWGYIAFSSQWHGPETVDFGVTFASNPIVLVSVVGYHSTSTTYGVATDNYGVLNDLKAIVRTVSTTSFEVDIGEVTGARFSGNAFYTWIAIGTLE